MNYIAYIIRFIFRIKWWLIFAPMAVGFMVYLTMGAMPRKYKSSTTIYTGIVSGYDIESDGGSSKQDWNIINNAMDNLINIIRAQTTLQNVSLRLYAQDMVYGDEENNNNFITARNYRDLLRITPLDVKELIDRGSVDNTYEKLGNYEKAEHNNFIYGLFHWEHRHYSYGALSKIEVKRIGNSDMLEVSYENDDPSIVYNTLVLLNEEFVKQYQTLRFGETNNVIEYFKGELARVGGELRNMEDSLRDYNVANRVINYEEQTKHIASLSRDHELRYEEILLNYKSAEKLRNTIEAEIEGLQNFKNNADFVERLHTIGQLQSRITTAEAFQNADEDAIRASEAAPKRTSVDVPQLKKQLEKQTAELRDITTQLANKQYTKEGVSTNSMIAQWLDAVLLFAKSKAELDVMVLRKVELDSKYELFSPIGSTLKRKNREISFSEQSYLSILHALNTALLRQKNLQMSSATLKIINAPVLPISAEPSKRKLMVFAVALFTLFFVFGLFLLIEIFDRTLRDKIRTERITGRDVLGAFPGSGGFGLRRYNKTYRDIASKYMYNAILNYFKPTTPNIVNFISTATGDGKTTLMESFATQLRESGMKVRVASCNKDFDVTQKEYLLANSITDFIHDKEGEVSVKDADVILIEYPSFDKASVPKELLQTASVNILVAAANRTWKDSDQMLLEKTAENIGGAPLELYLNYARIEAVEIFTGLMPPYTGFRKIMYSIGQFGFTSLK